MKANNFSLKDKNGINYSLEDLNSNFIILYFYPKDNTPGCTIEAIQFSKYVKEFEKLNARVIGISGGDEKTKTKFCEKHNLKILLLSDPDFSVSKTYGVYGEKSFMGKKYFGISRVTFILDKNKKIIKTYNKVKPPFHSSEVLEFLKNESNK
jgi:peroxiredoxin Q/BCP